MRLLDLVKQARALYESGTAIHLVGPPGIGKTDVTEVIRDTLSAAYNEQFGYASELLTIRDAPDIGGFLLPAKAADGTTGAFYTRSPLLPSKDYLAAHPRGLFVLDERNQSDLMMQKACAPAVLWKRFGGEYLPKGWWVISTSNRVEDRSGVIRSPMFLTNRERILNIDPDVASWAVWAEAHGVHPMGIAFAKQRPGIVFSESVPKHDGPFCTPRSFVSAMNFLARAAGTDTNGNVNMELPSDSLVCQIVQGDVGEAAAAEMFAFFKLNEHLPTIDEIEKNPTQAKCPERLDAAFVAAQMCVHFAKAGNIDKLWTYVERLPKELQVSTAASLVEKSGAVLLNSQALTTWMGKNKALINASNR